MNQIQRTASRATRVVLGHATLGMMLAGWAGCVSTPTVPPDPELRRTAMAYLEMALRYPDNPVVRADAMEAAGLVLGSNARMWLRDGLDDEHPAVRFAACMAMGKLEDPGDPSVVAPLCHDEDPNVRIGAYFVMERTGNYRYRVAWRDLLTHHPDPRIRRNAALALGHLEDPAVKPLLRRAASMDADEGVKVQALEGLALLNDRDAIGQFLYQSFGGPGFKQPFALLTLGRTADPRAVPALRRGLDSAPYLEARLAAARSLALQGHAQEGLDKALDALDWSDADPKLVDDPPDNQIMRIRTMAAMALGQIGDRKALPGLIRRMEDPSDPRVQLAAATAILMILDRSPGDTTDDWIEDESASMPPPPAAHAGP